MIRELLTVTIQAIAVLIVVFAAGALVYVLAAEWAGRITGHPEPEPITFAGGGW